MLGEFLSCIDVLNDGEDPLSAIPGHPTFREEADLRQHRRTVLDRGLKSTREYHGIASLAVQHGNQSRWLSPVMPAGDESIDELGSHKGHVPKENDRGPRLRRQGGEAGLQGRRKPIGE